MKVVGVTRIMTERHQVVQLILAAISIGCAGFALGYALADKSEAVELELNNCLIFASTFDSSTGADIRDACIAVAYP